MKKISSGQTFFVKRLFPVLWLGVVLAFFIVSFVQLLQGKVPVDAVVPFLVVPVVMVVFGVFLFRKLVWNLADVVFDRGDFLLVRKSGVEQKIPLSEIMNVSMSSFSNPPRLSLRLRQSGKFGEEVVFVPIRKFSINPFARNEVAEDLLRRCDAARRNAK